MNRQKAILAAVVLCAILLACNKSRDHDETQSDSASDVVTEDIQRGIEKHIEEQIRLGKGYFNLSFGEKELRLKLVRVHTEYLANLAPGRHFACVDLASIEGDVYDVDFFLTGDPSAITVTETTLHKINGQPLYLWQQKRDKTWKRVPVDKAPKELLGVITGRDEFEFLYRVTLPTITDAARMWIPIPATDAFQTVEIKSIEAPGQRKMLTEPQHGNSVLLLTLAPQDSGKTIAIRFNVTRREKPVYPADPALTAQYLDLEPQTQDSQKFSSIAQEVVQGKTGDLVRARALYDHVIDRMRYMKFGPGWGKADAAYACDARTGNCSDFHAYFIALLRSAGIPARFAVGAAIPSQRDTGGIDGYHCWAEFYTDGHWWPVDVSEGDKHSALSTYYFGHHPANRIELSRGRSLDLEPGPQSGPINFLAYPLLEINGNPTKVKVQFSFKRKTPG